MELQDFTMIARRGYFIDAPSELRLIGPLLNKKEMKELFELIGRDDPYYHPYYIPYEEHCWDFYPCDDEELKKYKEYFINKIKEYYQGPDIILARKETKGGIAYHREYSGKCQVLMLANKNAYELPPHTDEYSQNADKYFKQFHDKMRRTMDAQGRIHTLSECKRYADYFVVELPGEFECREVGMGNEKIKLFVENFKKDYKREDANHSLC